MNYSIIGNKIKELRQVVDITQGELADGICTQALISRMEKGDIYPNATTLYQISKKLGVDVNYFVSITFKKWKDNFGNCGFTINISK
jgi:transcriptional regulator with XRE-family HTH domain